MPRLQIRLPSELGTAGGGRARTHDSGTRRSRPLGGGIEGADDMGQQVLRWHACWAESDEPY